MALWDNLGAGFALGNATGTVAACPRYAEILGLAPEATIGLTMESVTHPDDIKVNRWLLDNTATGAGGFVVRKRYIKADGSIQWVENRIISFGQTNIFPTLMLACFPIRDPPAGELCNRPIERSANYVADMAAQLAFMADGARLGDAADLLRLAAATIKSP